MNVSRHGYYTTEYIDHRRHGTPRSPMSPRSPETQQFSIHESPQSAKMIRFDLPSLSESAIEFLTDPDDLPEDITPAQLTYLHKGQTPQPERQRASVSYDNYYRTKKRQQVPDIDDDLFTDQASSTNTEEILFHDNKPKKEREPLQYQGYYIDQKKRYDNAEFVKPRNYTHKTFKEVFKADKGDERYNPIDLVFEDPQEIRELEQKKKFSRAVKTVQKKMGKNDYESYDYYVQQKLDEERRLAEQAKEQKRIEKENMKREKQAKKQSKKKSLKLGILPRKSASVQEEKEVFIDNQDGDSDIDVDEEHQGSKQLRKNIKKKWNLAKKQLEENYFDNYAKNMEEKDQALPTYEPSPMPEAQLEEMPVVEQERTVGPNSNFNPMWNYLLSYLVYNQSNSESQPENEAVADTPPDKIVEILDTEAPSEKALVVKSKKQKKTKKPAKKNSSKLRAPKMKFNLQPYKEVLKNWNQPTSAYLAGQRVPPRGAVMVPAEEVNDHLEIQSEYELMEYPEEHMIYFDDDELVDDELIFDPKTGTFLPVDSTSLLVQDTSKFSELHHGAPLRIILNINELIKSIKIMKIIFAPIDVISEIFPNAQTLVVLVELIIFMWMLYELSLLIDALCMAVKAVCAPMIAIGRFMNRIM